MSLKIQPPIYHSAPVTTVMYVISCYIGPRYNCTQIYVFHIRGSSFAFCRKTIKVDWLLMVSRNNLCCCHQLTCLLISYWVTMASYSGFYWKLYDCFSGTEVYNSCELTHLGLTLLAVQRPGTVNSHAVLISLAMLAAWHHAGYKWHFRALVYSEHSNTVT